MPLGDPCHPRHPLVSPAPKAKLFSLQWLRDPAAPWLLPTQEPAAFHQAGDPSPRWGEPQSPHGAEILLPRVPEGTAWRFHTEPIRPWVQESGRACQPPPACICPMQGHRVATGEGNGLGTSLHGTQLHPGSSTLLPKAGQPHPNQEDSPAHSLPVSCGDPMLSSHTGQKQMLKPQTFVINHSSVPLNRCCSVRLLALIGFRMIIVIIIPVMLCQRFEAGPRVLFCNTFPDRRGCVNTGSPRDPAPLHVPTSAPLCRGGQRCRQAAVLPGHRQLVEPISTPHFGSRVLAPHGLCGQCQALDPCSSPGSTTAPRM